MSVLTKTTAADHVMCVLASVTCHAAARQKDTASITEFSLSPSFLAGRRLLDILIFA